MTRFQDAFSIVLFLSCIVSFLVEISKHHENRYNWRFRYMSRNSELMIFQEENDRLWNEQLLNEKYRSYLDISHEDRTQNFVYTGDIPEFKSEYLLKSWSTTKPLVLEINPHESSNYYYSTIDLMRDAIGEEK